MRWSESWWLKEWHLYRCLFFCVVLVIAQLCWRTLGSVQYTQMGFRLSNRGRSFTLFSTIWLAADVLHKQSAVVGKSCVFHSHDSGGNPILLASPRLSLCRYAIGALVFCHTNLIAALAPRYCIYYQPLLILSGVAATVGLYDRLLLFARHEGNSAVARPSRMPQE